MSIITLTTDYGTRDAYVAAVKGVILGIAPRANIVDVTHEIEPQNVRHGAFVLWQTARWFPRGTIHVVVVDPGVGSRRRILLGRFGGQYVLAPDNGLLSFIHEEAPADLLRVVEQRKYMLAEHSTTFHGRDIIAPVAAHLANGVPPEAFGPAAEGVEPLPIPFRAERKGDELRGAVLHVDRFGTLITNIHVDQLASLSNERRALSVNLGGTELGPIRSAFFEVAVGEALAFLGSGGLLEIAINRGRAADRFGSSATVSVRAENGR